MSPSNKNKRLGPNMNYGFTAVVAAIAFLVGVKVGSMVDVNTSLRSNSSCLSQQQQKQAHYDHVVISSNRSSEVIVVNQNSSQEKRKVENTTVEDEAVLSSSHSSSSPPNTSSSTAGLELFQQPQVFNFIKELQCRAGHLDVPPLLNNTLGRGKVVVDIGLDAGHEFFAALESGYSVYGFEANPLTINVLRPKCESAATNNKKYKCVYVNAANITGSLPPIVNGGYLIEGGAGSERGVLNMSLSGPGSSFVEVAPGVKTPTYKQVTILPVSDVVKTDVFFFKLDVQGFEFEVLKGSKQLFDDHVVKTLLMEVYPRGLGNAGVDFLEFLNYLWTDLGMFCSSSNPGKTTFEMNHPNEFSQLAQYMKGIADSETAKVWWAAFDDFYCFNMRKMWSAK